MVKRRIVELVVVGAAASCNVTKAAPTTGGVNLDGGAEGGTESGAEGGAAWCPAALVVANSDFTSTNISVLSPAGSVLSESIISSASAPPGLTTALSGDVVFPLEPTPGVIVLIDRFPNSVVTSVDPSTAMVMKQLPVGTGFAANPHDYLAVSATKAYVSRYESNPHAGKEPNDDGGDLLIIDPTASTITGRVPFATEGTLLPRPDRMIRVGDEVWVSLHRFDADFTMAGDARFVGVSTADDSIAWSLDLLGVASCGGIAIAPAGDRVAVSCSGVLGKGGTDRSAIVLLDATAHPPREIRRFEAASDLGAPLGSTVAFANAGLLVGVALGDMAAKRNDVAFTLDLESGAVSKLLDAGAAFALGDVRCLPGCGDVCYLADAQANALRAWKVNGTTLEPQASVTVDPTIGLPPRAIGAL